MNVRNSQSNISMQPTALGLRSSGRGPAAADLNSYMLQPTR